MNKKKLFSLILVMLMLLVFSIPAAAITDGELAGEDYPYVVLLQMDTEKGFQWRCSATMLSPTIALTAGHCTSNFGYIEDEGPYSAMRVYTESDVENGNNTYPDAGGPNSVEAVSWAAHPLYETFPWFMNDVGVVILEEPGVVGLTEYGVLPVADQLDVMKTKRGRQDVTFTAVGYGLQKIVGHPFKAPRHLLADKIRMVAYPKLNQINAPGFTGDFSLLLSNNHSTGGTCFGDSGGPNFVGDSRVVAGVTSFGLNGNCGGTGGVFRVDRQNVLDFVNTYLNP